MKKFVTEQEQAAAYERRKRKLMRDLCAEIRAKFSSDPVRARQIWESGLLMERIVLKLNKG